KPRKVDDMPEIVVGAVPEPGGKPKKAAPPRPEELAKAPAPKVVPPAARPQQSAIPGVIRLTDGAYELPPLHLFEAAERVETEFDRDFVLEQAQRLVAALAEFRIKGKVTKIHPGPVITRYEFKPEAGVKLSKIESLENDIAMALEAVRIRILAPIPGKSTVGFEVPNKGRETVYIKEILAAENFGAGNKLPLALGKDITGNVTFTDLAKAPHLLVAGATGSGKSVGVNAMVCSLLYTCSPEDVRMVMIDPKMLELSIYEGIPHLLLPVVTDPEKAALALRWAVQEMERRYALLSEAQVRDIAGYNRKLPELQAEWDKERRLLELAAAEVERDAAEHGEDGADGTKLSGTSFDAQGNPRAVTGGQVEMPERPAKLPYIVVIIDEFADLMMVASKEVEQCVARIAAKARAAGLHLIVATQRPSVDVITGTIKNNFPSRIAFQVTSEVDSRTILDGKGAKQLLGMGDMLHMDRGMQAQRVHGCFVSEDEILKVVEFVKRQAKPVYNMDIVRKRDDDGELADADENLDPMYDRAVEIVAEAQKVSTSMLQRRLGIGYNRAAKIVEAMEERGVIGPARGTTPREVFVTAA
ncbi:MAG: DNA translocase FtsK, partial [Nannocystaceae bacterium]|nr:DNA translocase FtsK [Nannocystaceae bacterium]